MESEKKNTKSISEEYITKYQKMFDDGLREELRIIYIQRMEWARHFNHLLWYTFYIVSPITIIGIALYNRLNIVSYVFIGAASILILFLWHFIAEGHRRLWEERFNHSNAIEIVWGAPLIKRHAVEQKNILYSFINSFNSVRMVRIYLVFGTIILWIVSILSKFINK